MTNIHKAAREALEALRSVQDHRPNDETNAAIKALRAALDEAPGDERDERAAFEDWIAPTLRNGSHLNRSRVNQVYTDNRVAAKWAAWQARAMLAARPEVPQGEPGAWVRRHPDGTLTRELLHHSIIEPVRQTCGAWVPLYAARPAAPTVALTEERADCELPPLPSPATRTDFHHDGYGLPAYTADQMHVHAALAAAIERERCARICEQSDDDGEGPDSWGWHSKDYAKAIRKEGGA